MSIYEEAYDVIVAGGGPSGVAAAIAASRNGSKVLIIERYGFFGGMATNALVPILCPYSDGEKAIIGGIGLEILESMKKEAWENPYVEENNGIPGLDWVPIDPEVLKRILDEKILESGCHILLHSYVSDVLVEDGLVKGVYVINKSGTHLIQGKLFIDCTGDADLVALSGGSFEYGDETASVQGVTLCFRLANVKGEKFLAYKKEHHENGNLDVAIQRARANNDFPFNESHVATFTLQHSDVAGLNFGHVYEIDTLNAEDLTKAEIGSRQLVPKLIRFLRKYVPGLEDSILVSSGPSIGIRESRRIIGEYRLTKQDYLNRADFEDTIARYAYPIDIHASKPREIKYERELDEFFSLRYQPGESYGVPFRALLPKKLMNVIVAGRTLSADRAMHGSFRVMPACFATGEAAGIAAALCCKEDQLPRDINITQVQHLIQAQGGFI